MTDQSLRTFCSVYGYNGSVTPDTEAYGLSYAEIVANYHTVDFAKDEIGDLSSTTTSTSNTALSDSERSSAYDSIAYSETGSSYNSSEASYESTEAPIRQVTNGRQGALDLSSLLEDGPLYYTDVTAKTFAQLKKRDLKAGDGQGKRYEDGPLYEASYSDKWDSSADLQKPKPSKTSAPNDYENEGYAIYSVSGDNTGDYETSQTASTTPQGKLSVGNSTDGLKTKTRSNQYENDAYVTPTAAPGDRGDSYAQSQDGSYTDYGTSSVSSDGYSKDDVDGNYTSGSIGADYRDGDETDVKKSTGDALGFGGLNQTQHRLAHEEKIRKHTSRGLKRTESKRPLYVESQETDFFRSFSWNERWQALLERPTVTPEEIRQRAADIEELTEQFLEVAKPIVTRIVEELWLPNDTKTIKPVDVGGIAGGEKYMAKQLFMKYARDNIRLRLYDGDSWAQKAALHELKSLNALIACNIPNLHFPLMACLSCYGHCVVVVSKLPLSKKTLVYGSDDVAKTIRTDREVGGLFKQAAEMLNLEPHYVTEGSTRLEKLMYGPVDIEGHKGLDGRSYIVDTARLFPPAPPIRGVRGCHLYKLLRKELVRSNPVPLSSDAFSFFGKVNEMEHNIPVTDAVNRIFDVLIPQFFNLPNINEILQSGGDRITKEMHELGINVRFLGCILDYALNLATSSGSFVAPDYQPQAGGGPNSSTSPNVPVITQSSIHGIIREMICRASKHVFFNSMRTNLRPNFATKDECRRLAADHWNHLLFTSALYKPLENVQADPTKYHLTNEAVDNWWKTQLIPTLKQRFIFFNGDGRWTVPMLAQIEEAANRVISFDLVMQALKEAPADVFSRSALLTGVVFNAQLLATVASGGNAWFSSNKNLLDTDLVLRIDVLDKRVKFMPFLSSSFADAERFYLAEIANRISALGSNHPQVAISYRHLGELYADQPGSEENARSSLDRAAAIYRSYHSKDPDALVRDLGEIMNLQADLLLKYDRLQLAQHKLFELLDLYRPVTLGMSSEVECESSSGCGSNNTCGSNSELKPTSLVLFDGQKLHYVRSITNRGDLEDAANVLDKLAFVKLKLGLFPDASNCFALAYECKIKIFGTEQCWQVARTLNGQAQLLFASGQTIAAKEMCLKVHKITIETRGAGHSEVGIAKDNLARVLSAEGSHDDADELYKAALEIKVASLGEKHSFVAMSWDNMASNRLERLLNLARGLSKSSEISSQSGNGTGNSTLLTQTPFPITRQNVNPADLEDIALLYEKSLEAIEKSLGKLHSAYGISASNLAVTKAYLRQWSVAERLSNEALTVLSSTLGSGNPSALVVSNNLNYLRGALSKSLDEQQSIAIQSDALRRVHHSSLASSAPSGSATSTSSSKSRIPDKIKQLLEKKGIAVTEENAAKVQELLRRKRETSVAPALTTGTETNSAIGFTPSQPTIPLVVRKQAPISKPSRVAFDPYENEPGAASAYAELPTSPATVTSPIVGYEHSQYPAQGGAGGLAYENAPPYENMPSLIDPITLGGDERRRRRQSLEEEKRDSSPRGGLLVTPDSSRSAIGDYENVEQQVNMPPSAESDSEGADESSSASESSATPAPAPAPKDSSMSAVIASDADDDSTQGASKASEERLTLADDNDLSPSTELLNRSEGLSARSNTFGQSTGVKRDASQQSSSSPSLITRLSALFSRLVKKEEPSPPSPRSRAKGGALSQSSPSSSPGASYPAPSPSSSTIATNYDSIDMSNSSEAIGASVTGGMSKSRSKNLARASKSSTSSPGSVSDRIEAIENESREEGRGGGGGRTVGRGGSSSATTATPSKKDKDRKQAKSEDSGSPSRGSKKSKQSPVKTSSSSSVRPSPASQQAPAPSPLPPQGSDAPVQLHRSSESSADNLISLSSSVDAHRSAPKPATIRSRASSVSSSGSLTSDHSRNVMESQSTRSSRKASSKLSARSGGVHYDDHDDDDVDQVISEIEDVKEVDFKKEDTDSQGEIQRSAISAVEFNDEDDDHSDDEDEGGGEGGDFADFEPSVVSQPTESAPEEEEQKLSPAFIPNRKGSTSTNQPTSQVSVLPPASKQSLSEAKFKKKKMNLAKDSTEDKEKKKDKDVKKEKKEADRRSAPKALKRQSAVSQPLVEETAQELYYIPASEPQPPVAQQAQQQLFSSNTSRARLVPDSSPAPGSSPNFYQSQLQATSRESSAPKVPKQGKKKSKEISAVPMPSTQATIAPTTRNDSQEKDGAYPRDDGTPAPPPPTGAVSMPPPPPPTQPAPAAGPAPPQFMSPPVPTPSAAPPMGGSRSMDYSSVSSVTPPARPTSTATGSSSPYGPSSKPTAAKVGAKKGPSPYPGSRAPQAPSAPSFRSEAPQTAQSHAYGGQQLPPEYIGGQMIQPLFGTLPGASAGPSAPSTPQSLSEGFYGGQAPSSKIARGYGYAGNRRKDMEPSMWQTANTASYNSNEEVAEQLLQQARQERETSKAMPEVESDILDDLDDEDLEGLLDDPAFSADSTPSVPNKGASWGWGAI